MAYPRRDCQPNLTYHVYSRCIEKRKLLKRSIMKDLLVEIIKSTQKKYDFELIAFEILGNHFHFVIKTVENGETISKVIQRIKSVFAKKYNKLMDRTGPFWNERFGSKIVEKQENPWFYLLYLLWYIAYNSVREQEVDDPRSSKYGSIMNYLKEDYNGKLKITLHDAFWELGDCFKIRVKRFLEYEKIYLENLLRGEMIFG